MDIGANIRKESKQDRSGFNGEDCFQERNSKLSRTRTEEEEFKTISFHQTMRSTTASLLPTSESSRQEQMLSFSDDSKNTNTLSPYLLPPPYSRTSGGGGYGYGGMMMSMQGKGPFTLTQWAELEQQALIYKYITANVPVPSSLLISIKKSFYPYGSLPPSSFGWGTFHLGFAGGNMDPEPGRCRRTDGKKWRCSRDAVPDQKYCERHINRGRHRSRKPVEVQSSSGLTASKAVTTTTSQVTNNKSNAARAASSNRSLAIGSLPNNSIRNPLDSSVYPPEDSHQKHGNNNNSNPFAFGHISCDSLLNPNTVKSYGSSYLDFSSNQEKHSGDHHDHNPWPPEELKPDWTQLSMSIPIASSSSSPSSTHNNNNNNNKIALSPLRLSSRSEFDFEETEPAVRKVNTWIPISWGNSLGGPLGEVLNSTGSSPTGVLQKSTFCSLSNNSSSLSSPIAENNHNRNNNNGECFLHYTT